MNHHLQCAKTGIHHRFVQTGLMDKQDIHILRLMGEIEENGGFSQRELSRRLNLSLGLVNTFLKRLVNKGYFKVKTMPSNRLKYFLTPEGVARKTRLTVEYLRYSTRFYRDIKQVLIDKFREMERDRVEAVLFFGVAEVAELAYLYMKLTPVRLVGIVDERHKGSAFFDFRVDGLDRLEQRDWDAILLTCLEDTEGDRSLLTQRGVDPLKILTL
jgi:DNA-binding MarR family transcriptional regulator